MSLRHRLFTLPMPAILRAACIRQLTRLTATAFGAAPPRGGGLCPAVSLGRYAAFTREQAESVLRTGAGTAEVQERLYAGARELGRRLRTVLGIRRAGEAMSVARALYRLIEVDFRSARAGFTVSRCFFSAVYSPEVCRLVSSLDAGLLSGLSGGGRMLFLRRITEGAPVCEGVVQ